ncbi:MAG: hypothetical protein E7522_00745 [Ruminococcaceae bacterium]|nr:hypothetical protein [Oscillospiraceae bacterium]
MAKLDKSIRNISITNMPAISAIYFALLQSGYDYYSLGRTEEELETVKSFYNPEFCCDFFSQTKQNTCETYSYWPRAALLESAVFYLDSDLKQFSDFEAYKNFVMLASNLQDIERNENFWDWISYFPMELNKVINNEYFKKYLIWENTWIERENQTNAENLITLQEIIKICTSKYNAQISNIKIVLSPIKCAYSSDYHFVNGEFIFSSGQFSLESVVHEFLHRIVHPHVCKNQNIILVNKKVFDCIDSSYYLSNSENGKLNAFEEYLVKSLTRDFINKTPPDDLDKYIVSLLNEV